MAAPGAAGGQAYPADDRRSLAGTWRFTIRRPAGTEVALRLNLVPEGRAGWTAHSRPGAAAEFVGRRRALLGRLLGRMPPHAALQPAQKDRRSI